ncbi:MAG TPA: DsbA family protein [Thermomicrobiaceae bacterium]|nr:DsbA family protein [Thermomicrobiaceae bacterium]
MSSKSNRAKNNQPAVPAASDMSVRHSRRAARRVAEEKSRKRRQYMFVGGVVIVVLAVVVALIIVNRPKNEAVPTILAASPLPSTLKTDGRSIGNPNAPVKVVEWGDYQCSSCDYFYNNGQTQFLNQYVATGKVYFSFRDFPFFGQQSENAAAAAWCANDQGKYWEFHDTMYGNQPPENTNQITHTFLQTVASTIGLNMQQFNSCYDSGKYKSKVSSDLNEAKSLKINGTPTFYVNGTAVSSANYSDLQSAIEKALKG